MIWLPPKKCIALPSTQRGFIGLPAGHGVPRKPNTDTDPHFASVVSLLHFDGSDQDITYTDQTGKAWSAPVITWTAGGNAQIDTAQSLYGGSSLLLDGSGDYIFTADSSVYEPGSGDYTIESAIRLPSVGTGNLTVCSKYTSTGSQRSFIFSIDTTANTISWTQSSDGVNNTVVSASFTWAVNTWYKLAASRVGSTVYLFVDGSLITSGSASALFNSTASLIIGARNSGGLGAYFNGWIDEFRFTLGVGRYSAGYTPSGSAFPNDYSDTNFSSVVALLHFDGTDAATTFTEDAYAPRLDTAQSVYGGASCYFSGNYQRLSTATGADWNFGSGGFTVETAFRCSDVSQTRYLFTTRGSPTTVGVALLVAAGQLQGAAWDGSGNVLFAPAAGSLSDDTWYRVAYVRSGNLGYLFIDGAMIYSGAFTGTVGNAATVHIGHDPSAAGPRNWKGWIDELRVTKGVGRYTTNYGVRPKAFADS